MKLVRTIYSEEGIFGELLEDDNSHVCFTLEHSYHCISKLAIGNYTCVRGSHLLGGMVAPFITFEITNVPGHTDILFHVGNYNDDSSGCVLLGTEFDSSSNPTMLMNSKSAFDYFMQLNQYVDSFELTVS